MAITSDGSLGWAALRATRADAPAGIKGARHKTYVAALEQAQQMFTAAASVGVATRPLLLFYGLSQGGRAIAAAAKHVRNTDYPLIGHGIKADTNTLTGPITQVQVYGDSSEKGSFTRLSKILGSPAWDRSAPVLLGELWNSLPEGSRIPLHGSTGAYPLGASVDEYSVYENMASAGPVHLSVSHIPASCMPSDPRSGPTPELKALLGKYPSLAGYTDMQIKGVFPDEYQGSVHLVYPSSNTGYHERMADALAHTTVYRMRSRYVFPAVGQNTDPVHPIMAWWALLFALSMLARYHPEAWADHIAVDSSKAAVPIEQLLANALHVVPDLLLRTITDVSK